MRNGKTPVWGLILNFIALAVLAALISRFNVWQIVLPAEWGKSSAFATMNHYFLQGLTAYLVPCLLAVLYGAVNFRILRGNPKRTQILCLDAFGVIAFAAVVTAAAMIGASAFITQTVGEFFTSALTFAGFMQLVLALAFHTRSQGARRNRGSGR